MTKIRDIYDFLDAWAPFSTQMDFDNAGLLVGGMEAEVRRVLVALDATGPVVREAVRRRCQLILTHHPIIFHPLKRLTPDDTVAVKLIDLTKKNVAVLSAHTNLDVAPGGVNDALVDTLGLPAAEILEPMGVRADGTPYGLGRVVQLPEPMAPGELARLVKKKLGARGVRAALGKGPVRRLAVGGGACGDMVELADRVGCDAFLTADVKHDRFLEAAERGMTLIDGGHFATEYPIVPRLAHRLQERFGDDGVEVLVAKADKEVYFTP